MRIVYIAGLGYSGSTILNMALGCHPEMIGLGEIFQLLKASGTELEDNSSKYHTLLCSCGERINNCAFWHDARQLLIRNQHLPQVRRYQEIVEYAQSLYGNDYILVDSSKMAYDSLKEINRRHDLRVIFLVRDFRSWCYSRNRKIGLPVFRLGSRWVKGNLRTWRFLNKNKLVHKTIGYEEMALYPDVMLKQICDFIGVEYNPRMLCPDNTKSHIVEGNAARGDKEKRECIRYDARWMTSPAIALYSVLLFPLLLVNRRLVYSNFLMGKGVAFGRKGDDFLLFSVKKKEEMIHHTQRIQDRPE